ncbi:MAG: hypothetical protein N2449_05490 [Bacteroidales bacterium]|nr:hypothetical protein [Bacteroidales bacterium]
MSLNETKTKYLIINTLQEKNLVKKNVYKSIQLAFDNFKVAIKELIDELNAELKEKDEDYTLECYVGNFHIELYFGNDVVVFYFQNNVYEIDKSHSIWAHSYIQDNPLNAFVGIIHVYNFIKNSYKNNENDGAGYLIARIFINQEQHYFVEGKRQLGFLYNDFSQNIIGKDDFKKIIQSVILYCLDFEMLVPPYEEFSVISVEQIKTMLNKSRSQNAKRMGFQFYKNDTSV